MKPFSLLALPLFISIAIFSQNVEIYVSDAGNFSSPPWQILKFDENGENPEVYIDDNLAWPQDILFLEDQNVVLISNLSSGSISKHEILSGDYIENFATGINGPTRMKIGPDELLYVLQWGGNGKVKRYHLDGTYIDDHTSTGVPQSIGLDWDNDGHLFVSSYNGDYVREFDSQGNDLGLFVDAELLGPTNIWFDVNGDLLVIDYLGTAVKRFDSDGNFIGDFIGGLSNAEGIDFFPNGSILVGNGATNAVKLFDSEGNYIEDIIESGSGGLLTPNAVVVRNSIISTIFETDLHPHFIRPGIGDRFYLNPQSVGNISIIKIYTLSGRMLERKTITDNNVWNAKNFDDGIYVIVALTTNGNTITQKVLVKK